MNSFKPEISTNSDNIILEKDDKELFDKVLQKFINTNKKKKEHKNNVHFKSQIDTPVVNNETKSKMLIDPYTGLPTNKHVNETKQKREEKLNEDKLAVEKLEAEKLEEEKLEAEKLAAEKLKLEKLALEKLMAEKLEAVNLIISYLEHACENGTFKKLEECYNIWSQILVLRDINQDNSNQCNALEFLLRAVKIANKRGAFELEESYKLAICFNLFIK